MAAMADSSSSLEELKTALAQTLEARGPQISHIMVDAKALLRCLPLPPKMSIHHPHAALG